MPSEQESGEVGQPEPPLECPFDECDWTSEIHNDGPDPTFDELDNYRVHEDRMTMHYDSEHAGRVKIRVTLEMEQRLGSRDPHDIADRYHDKVADRDDLHGWDVAYAVAEVIEDADPHPEVDDGAE